MPSRDDAPLLLTVVRVVGWNINWGANRSETIGQALLALHGDVAFCTEYRRSRTGDVRETLARLAPSAHLEETFHEAWVNGILSLSKHAVAKIDVSTPVVAGGNWLELHDTRTNLVFVGVRVLQFNKSEELRHSIPAGRGEELNRAWIGEQAARLSEAPAILIGDFNCRPDHSWYRSLLAAGWIDVFGAREPNGPSYGTSSQIDRALLSPAFRGKVVSADYVYQVGRFQLFERGAGRLGALSDHAPIVVDLEL